VPHAPPISFSLLFIPLALQSLTYLGPLTYKRFPELFRHTVRLLGRVISPSQGLYLHMTTQHRKTRTNVHALSGIRTNDPSNQSTKTHASDRTATVTGLLALITLTILGEEYKPCSSSLCSFFQRLFTSSLSGPNILLSTLFSNTLRLCSSLKL
jgi:hypothetical protein